MRLDFESGEPSSGVPGVAAVSPPAADAIVVDCTVARRGRCSLRSRIRATPDYFSVDSPRAESSDIARHDLRYSAGETWRYEFSLRLARDWPVDDTGGPDAVWQFKRVEGPPDMFIGIRGRDLVLFALGRPALTLASGVPTGRWIDLRLQVRWSPGADGQVDVELATESGRLGSEALRYVGANMRDARPRAAYLKWGIYKSHWTAPPDAPVREVHHDEIAVFRVRGP